MAQCKTSQKAPITDGTLLLFVLNDIKLSIDESQREKAFINPQWWKAIGTNSRLPLIHNRCRRAFKIMEGTLKSFTHACKSLENTRKLWPQCHWTIVEVSVLKWKIFRKADAKRLQLWSFQDDDEQVPKITPAKSKAEQRLLQNNRPSKRP